MFNYSSLDNFFFLLKMFFGWCGIGDVCVFLLFIHLIFSLPLPFSYLTDQKFIWPNTFFILLLGYNKTNTNFVPIISRMISNKILHCCEIILMILLYWKYCLYMWRLLANEIPTYVIGFESLKPIFIFQPKSYVTNTN